MKSSRFASPLLLAATLVVVGCNGASDHSVPATAQAPARRSVHPAPPFDADRAWADLVQIVSLGPRPAGTPAMDQQRAFLKAELEKVGLTVVLETFSNAVPETPSTPDGRLKFTNLYADLEPTDSDADTPLVIVGSHMDTKRLGPNFVGANDGGSSTAAVLEIARGLASGPERAVGYRFLFLDGEEAVRFDWADRDHTYGSRYHATEASKRVISKRMAAFILLDLVGDKDLVLTKDQNSNRGLQDLFVKAGTEAGHGDLFWHPRVIPIKDDHLRFKEELGIPVIDLIDFDYGPRNAYWHTDLDTLEHCSADSLRKIGETTLAGLVALERKLLSEDAAAR